MFQKVHWSRISLEVNVYSNIRSRKTFKSTVISTIPLQSTPHKMANENEMKKKKKCGVLLGVNNKSHLM